MADTFTTNYNLTKPEVGGDSGSWGGLLNADLDAIDTEMKAISDDAGTRLPKSGGTMTGRLNAKDATMVRVDKGNVTGAVALDLATGNLFTLTVTGAATISAPTNAQAGSVVTGLILRITNGGAFALGFNSAFKFPGGSPPVLTAAGKDDLAFLSWDNGTTWELVGISKDVR